MTGEHEQDWDPTSEQSRQDQRATYDDMRKKCPVAYSAFFGWTLFRHSDVVNALHDPQTFSNAVSHHLSVPNGMDPPEHTEYRKIIEPYFSEASMKAFEPSCRLIARNLVAGLSLPQEVEFMREIALPFAVQVQCTFLGWPETLHQTLIEWITRNQQATLARDKKALGDIAIEFEKIINDLLEQRRKAPAEQDITAALMHEKVWGRPLSNEEIASILRNWTAGEIGTISAAVGILAQFLSEHTDLQKQLRSDPALLSYSIDEILRINGPLVANRRVLTRPVKIGGRQIPAGERISLNWISANRDETVFQDAHEFRFGRDLSLNLLYGAGIHVCPGAPLASLEMRVFMEELLAGIRCLSMGTQEPAQLAQYPSSGFSQLYLKCE